MNRDIPRARIANPGAPAALGRGTCSPRRIIDPSAFALLRGPARLLRLLGLAFLLRVFTGAFFLLLLPSLSLVAIWHLPSSPPVDSSLIVASPAVCGKRPQPPGGVSRTALVRNPAQLPMTASGTSDLFALARYNGKGTLVATP
jgi:hypothetical protein